jgi:peptidoglycan/xylan/chitin deacetylase (PgdA/CDA1 family)
MLRTVLLWGTVLFSFLLAGSSSKGVLAQNLVREIAILEIPSESGMPDLARTHSVKHMAHVAGVPYTVTRDVKEAALFSVIIATEGLDGLNLTDVQTETIKKYVQDGGVFISTNLKDTGLYDVAGITDQTFSRDRYSINFHIAKSDNVFKWIDEPEERTILIGNKNNESAMFSRSYDTDQAEILASFDDGTPAFIRNQFGNGFSYTFGNSFKDLIIRSQMNFDFSSNRTYSNGFEPASDVFSLIFRGILIEHIPHLVWKNTSAFNSRSAVILTHDIDAESNMQWMNRYADFENSLDITATYFVTTHYIDDALDGDYYSNYRDAVTLLRDQNQEVGSHSVGHFPDFAVIPFGTLGEDIFTYQPGHHGGITENASLLGELEVSKKLLEEDTGLPVTSFRSGYLIYPDQLISALDTLGYRFNSSYSANDVQTSFPYTPYKTRSFSSSESKILEIPVTISDVLFDEFTTENYLVAADLWSTVTEKYYANGAPTVLLVHPNRDLKLRAMQIYLENLPPDVSIQSIQSFGNFWLQRNDLDYSTNLENNRLTIQFRDHQTLPDSLSMNISNGSLLESIEVLGSTGNKISVLSQIDENGTLLIYKKENVFKSPLSLTTEKPVNLTQNYPNPFNSKTTIKYHLKEASNVRLELFTIAGKRVETLLNEYQQAGPHWLEFNAERYSSGLYVCRVSTRSYSAITLMTLIK